MTLVRLLRTLFFLPGKFHLSAGIDPNPIVDNGFYPEVAVPVFNRFPLRRKSRKDFFPRAIVMTCSVIACLVLTSVKVHAQAPVITYSSPNTFVYGTTISSFTPDISSGGTPDGGFTVSPALPSGLSLDPASGAISGTPTAALASAAYTVTATNASGSGSFDVYITVNTAPLTVTANVYTKQFGITKSFLGDQTTFTATGLVNGDVITGVTLATSNGVGGKTKAVGDYPLSLTPSAADNSGGLTFFNPANYTITYVANDFIIAPATLTITAVSPVSKTYGTALTSGSYAPGTYYTVSGLQNTDAINSATVTFGTGGAVNDPVGTYAGSVVITAVSGSATFVASNYTISYVAGDIQCTQATLVIIATGPAKPFGTALTVISGPNFSTIGLIPGDLITSVTLTPDANGMNASWPAGQPYTVTPSAAVGGGTFIASNYIITYNPYNGKVGLAPLIITANAASKVYGVNIAGGGGSTLFTAVGLQGTDAVTGVVLNYTAGGNLSTSAVGSYTTITPSAATGTGLANYTIVYNPGVLTVTPAPLTITANAGSKTYGTVLTSVGGSAAYTFSGIQNSETIGTVTLTYGAAGAGTGIVGVYAGQITPSAAVGGTFSASNYTITYNSGTLTVTPAAITIKANSVTKTYNTVLASPVTGSTAYTISAGSLFNGETIGSVTITYGVAGTVATTVPGVYAQVSPSAATGGTFSASNYTITYTANSGNITIYPVTPTYSSSSSCSGSSMTLTASGGLPAGGTYKWYADSASAVAGLPVLFTGNPYVTPSLLVSTTYYVTYTSGTTTPGIPATATLTPGPILATAPTSGAYFSYSFNGTNITGTAATDLAGTGNNATLVGGPTRVQDRYSQGSSALQFNGTSQYLTTTTKLPNPNTFSISVWFKTTSTNGGYIIGFGSLQTGLSPHYDRFLFMDNAGHLWFALFPSNVTNNINTTKTYNDGLWHHAVATFSTANGTSIYVDGALQGSDANMNTGLDYTTYGGGYWRIGYDNLNNWQNQPSTVYFNGTLDDIAILNTELDAAGVAALYGAGSTFYCPNNVLSLNVNTPASGSYTYSWTTTAANGFVSTTQNPTVTSNATANDKGTYTCVVTAAGGCTTTIKVQVPVSAIMYTWLGATNTSLTTPGNWACASATNSIGFTAGTTGVFDNTPRFNFTTNVTVPVVGTGNYPVMTQNEAISDLTINSGASFSLNGNALTLGCNIINNATTGGTGILWGNNNASSIIWNGATAAQSYTGTNNANTATLGGMTVNNSASGTVTLNSGPIDLYYLLTMIKGNLAVAASPAKLTLKSGATSTASVGPIPATCVITGNVSAERYMSATRGYRLIASPVHAATVGSDNVFSLNYVQNSAYITGTNAAGGFDKVITALNGPTIYLYDEAVPVSNASFISGNYRSINDLTQGNNATPTYTFDPNAGYTPGSFSLPVSNGFLFFFRGNRASAPVATETTTSFVATTATMVTSGTLNQQQVVFRDWYNTGSTLLGYSNPNVAAQGFNLVGNPYASSLDWETYNTTTSTSGIYTQNVSNSVYELNPVTWNYDVYQKGGAFTNSGSRVISSGQGFFVLALNGAGQVILNESAKVTTQAIGPNLMMSTSGSQLATVQTLRLQMAKDTINTDDLLISFGDDSKAAFDINEDAPYKKGSGKVSFASLSSDNLALAINRLPLITRGQTIPLSVNASTDGPYTLSMKDMKGIPQLYDIWLKDNLLKDSINLRVTNLYSFNIANADTTTYGKRRFALTLQQDPAYAYHLLTFDAKKVPDVKEVEVLWTAQFEENYTNFTVERSIDNGKTFNVIGSARAAGVGSYTFYDKNPVTGINIYRLKQVDINNAISYSKVVPVEYSNLSNGLAKNNLNLFPNPATSNINLVIMNSVNNAGSYNVMITNSLGFVIKKATIAQANWQGSVNDLLPGTYLVKVFNNKDQSLVGTTKFVKL